MRVAVTGAAGFLGRSICKLLREYQIDFLPIDNFSNPASLDFTKGILKADIAEADFKNCTAVINCAAFSAVSKTLEDQTKLNQTNESTARMIAKLDPKTRFIQISSAAVYGNNSYGLSKLSVEELVLSKFNNSLIVRLQNLYGPGQLNNSTAYGVVQKWLDADEILLNAPGTQVRNFVRVDVAAKLIITGLIQNIQGVVGLSGYNISMDKLAARVSSLTKKEIKIANGDPGILTPTLEVVDLNKFDLDHDYSDLNSFFNDLDRIYNLKLIDNN